MPTGMTRRPAAESPFRAANLIDFVSATVGADVANVINVACILQDANRNAIPEKAAVRAYLSDDAAGLVLTAVTPTSVLIGTNGLLLPIVASKIFQLVSSAAGLVDINITKNTTNTYYLNFILPDGHIQTVGPIALT